MIGTVLVLPSPPALLAPTSVTDPVAELRAACQDAVAGLPPGQKVIVLANPVSEANAERGITEPLGHRVARSLLGEVEFEPQLALPYAAAALLELAEPTTLLVMADGSARRSEKAPGHLHPDATAFDEPDRVSPAHRGRGRSGSARPGPRGRALVRRDTRVPGARRGGA